MQSYPKRVNYSYLGTIAIIMLNTMFVQNSRHISMVYIYFIKIIFFAV